MLGKIEYDVEVPKIEQKFSEIVEFYRGFMNDSTHKSVSVDFGEKKNVADISANTLRKHIRANSDDVSVNVRRNVLYVTKNNFTKEEVVVPKQLEEKRKGRQKKVDAEDVWLYYIMNSTCTQKDMAEHFRVSVGTINNILKSKRKEREFTEEKNGITDAELKRIAGK